MVEENKIEVFYFFKALKEELDSEDLIFIIEEAEALSIDEKKELKEELNLEDIIND